MKIGKKIAERLAERKKRVMQNCPACGGRGQIGGQQCNCSKTFEVELKWARAGIPLKFFDKKLEDFILETGPKQRVVEYIGAIEEKYLSGIGMYLQGTNGVGKSFLSCEILKAAIAKGHTAYFTTLADIITFVTAGWHDEGLREEFKRDIIESDFLVLDDLGKEYGASEKASALVDASFDSLFRKRSNELLPTIITSNCALEQVQGTYGNSLYSLFHENLVPVSFIGEDFRQSEIAPAIRAK